MESEFDKIQIDSHFQKPHIHRCIMCEIDFWCWCKDKKNMEGSRDEICLQCELEVCNSKP